MFTNQGTVPAGKVQAYIEVMEPNKRSVERGFLITTGSFAESDLDTVKTI